MWGEIWEDCRERWKGKWYKDNTHVLNFQKCIKKDKVKVHECLFKNMLIYPEEKQMPKSYAYVQMHKHMSTYIWKYSDYTRV